MKRFYEMDILRGLAIIGVIFIHVSSMAISNATSEMEGNIALFFNQVTRFAVPVFLILSGWGLTVSKKYNLSIISLIKNQLSKIIVFYLLWNFFYYSFRTENFNLYELAKGITLGESFYHLYYVPLIIALYLIYPFLYKYFRNSLGVLVIIAVSILSQVADSVTGLAIFNHELNIFNWVVYFVVGIWLAEDFGKKMPKIKERKNLFTGLFAITTMYVFYEAFLNFDTVGKALATTSMRPSIIVLSVLFVLLVLSIEWNNKPLKNGLEKLAGASYGMYLSHAFLLVIFEILWTKMNLSTGSVAFVLLAVLVVTPLSYCVSLVMDLLEQKVREFFAKQKPAVES